MPSMRRFALLSVAAVLAITAGAWAQQINPDRKIPGLPPLGKELPEPNDPADPQDQQQPDAQPQPDAKDTNKQGGRPVTGRPTPRPPETDDQLLARLAKVPDRRAARTIEREL